LHKIYDSVHSIHTGENLHTLLEVVAPIHAILRAATRVTTCNRPKTAYDHITTLLNCWWPCDRHKNRGGSRKFL